MSGPVEFDRIRRAIHAGEKDPAGWYWITRLPSGRIIGRAGCWRCGESWEFVSGGQSKLDKADSEASAAAAKALAREQEARQREIATELQRIWPALPYASPDHPYLARKGIQPHCARVLPDGVMVVPMVDAKGFHWGAEGISAEPRPDWKGNTKRFEPGARTKGCFVPIGDLDHAGCVVVCEGFATGATIYELTSLPVACAGYAGNIAPVAIALLHAKPCRGVIVAADNDRHNPENPGLTAANAVVRDNATSGVALAVPDFGDTPPSKDATDFNDLARLRGPDAVRAVFAAVPNPQRAEVFYDAARAGWWVMGSRGIFVPLNEAGARRHLKALGFDAETEKGCLLSPLDVEQMRLIREEYVEFAGPVAGWPAGLQRMCGRRILVTAGPSIPRGGAGDCSTLEGIFVRMLGRQQFLHAMWWLRCARKRVLTRQWHPMPALILVGPRNCGKSVFQGLINVVLGGRSAKPAQYLLGITPFNGDLFGAEHLSMEDETARFDLVSRRHFGETIKALNFCRQVQCHAKGRQGITLEPLWVLSISLNNEPEHLRVLPPIDESLTDKVLLFQCESHPRAVPDGRDETEWLTELLAKEGPAFIDRIDDITLEDIQRLEQELGVVMFNPRTRVAGWQHPDVIQAILEMAPESHLLSLIDDAKFAVGVPVRWRGTSEELSRELRSSEFGREAERILTWPGACGTYLARLARQFPDRVRRRQRNSGDVRWERSWEINPPGVAFEGGDL